MFYAQINNGNGITYQTETDTGLCLTYLCLFAIIDYELTKLFENREGGDVRVPETVA